MKRCVLPAGRSFTIRLAYPGFRCNVVVLTEHSLPGVRLPPDGVFTPLLSPALQCRSRISGPATNINRIKNIVMMIATHKTSTPASRKRGASKSLPDTVAEAAVPNPLKMATVVPSQEAIGTRAHEIWMSRGQEQGHGQEHWLEAERQLRQG